ncbi:MAG TPA: hypothetical protein VGC66_01060 [Pyrinomonadaceae bacterium]|jgi:hypothetical protein
MKQVTIRIAIGFCTFIIGVFAAADWLIKPATNISTVQPLNSRLDVPAPPVPEATSDSTIYSIKLCDLVRDSNHYDGKLVRIQAFYNQGVDTSSLDDSECDAWLRPYCVAGEESCVKIWDRISKVLLSSQSFRARVDLVGRYTADVVDPNPLQGGGHVHLFEILELKGAKPAKVWNR